MNVNNQQTNMDQLFTSGQSQLRTQPTAFPQAYSSPIGSTVKGVDRANFSDAAINKANESENSNKVAIAGISKMVDKMGELASSAADMSLSEEERQSSQKTFDSLRDSMETTLKATGNESLISKIDKTIEDGLKTADGEVVESSAQDVRTALLKSESGKLDAEALQGVVKDELGSASLENIQKFAEDSVEKLTKRLGSQDKAIEVLNGALADYGVSLDKNGLQVATAQATQESVTSNESSEEKSKTTFDLNSSQSAQAATNIMEDIQSVLKSAVTSPQSEIARSEENKSDFNNMSALNATQMQTQRMLNLFA